MKTVKTIKNYFLVSLVCLLAVILAAIIKDLCPLLSFALFALVD